MQTASVSTLKRQLKEAGINVLTCQKTEAYPAVAMVDNLTDEQIAALLQIAPNTKVDHVGSGVYFIHPHS